MNKIDVLDHGYVRLVSYMQPASRGEACRSDAEGIGPVHADDHFVDIDSHWTGDLEIVRNARVSYDADWRGATASVHPEQNNKDVKLINYLYEHAHTSPFEVMVFTFEVQAPIFIFRQWHRHRTWSYNEVSARYTELPDIFYVPDVSRLGEQSKTNKQGTGEALPEDLAILCMQEIRRSNAMAYEQYKQLLRGGLSRELARMILPVNIYSRMFATVDLHNLFKFLTLRLDEHAQMEIRVYAEALLRLVQPIVPVAVGAFLTAGGWELDPDHIYKLKP